MCGAVKPIVAAAVCAEGTPWAAVAAVKPIVAAVWAAAVWAAEGAPWAAAAAAVCCPVGGNCVVAVAALFASCGTPAPSVGAATAASLVEGRPPPPLPSINDELPPPHGSV